MTICKGWSGVWVGDAARGPDGLVAASAALAAVKGPGRPAIRKMCRRSSYCNLNLATLRSTDTLWELWLRRLPDRAVNEPPFARQTGAASDKATRTATTTHK
ncbi:hypothetical protein TPAR_02229 [Tolypocladium paradoxum]|uniref:Uncharacterized protein n=1 Tax=Tolypocladium paradoxum TaxID=94208 RepID=A0A2S4L574_9HYPO|nr:hypothetical protein TPAR_02229 [Tolypocladium paradoxum]